MQVPCAGLEHVIPAGQGGKRDPQMSSRGVADPVFAGGAVDFAELVVVEVVCAVVVAAAVICAEAVATGASLVSGLA